MSQQIAHDAHDAYVTYDAYVEILASGACRAQLLDLPGCFAIADDVTAAVSALEGSIPAYYEWLRSHDEYTPIVVGPFHVEVKDTSRSLGNTHTRQRILRARCRASKRRRSRVAAGAAGVVAGRPAPPRRAYPRRTARYTHARRPTAQRVCFTRPPKSQARYLVMLNDQPDPTAAVALADAPPLEQLREVKDVSLRRLRNTSDDERGRIIEVLGERWSLHKILRCGILSARMCSRVVGGCHDPIDQFS